MKHLVYALTLAALVSAGGTAASAQAGRRAGTSSEIAVPLELPPPPDFAPAADPREGEVAECDCLRLAAAGEGAGAPPEPAGEEQAFRSSEVDVKAVVTHAPDPAYTLEAREAGTSGRVVLRVVLGASGKVTTVRVVEGLPEGLTANSVDAACRIEFRPAQKGGRAVAQYATVEFNFEVDDRRFGPGFPGRPPARVPTGSRIPLPRVPLYLPAPGLHPAPPWGRLPTPPGCGFTAWWL